MAGPVDGALNEAGFGPLTTAGSGAAALNLSKAEGLRVDAAGAGAAALNTTEAEGLRVDEAGGGAAALTGPGDLVEAGSGERVGGVGEEEAPSAGMDARGGKHRRARCSST